MRPAIFLDRDDTLVANAELDWSAARPPLRPGDLCDPERLVLLPGALDACRALRRAGFRLVVVTNQGLVAMGGGALADVHATHDRLHALLADAAGEPLLDAVYFAPHHPGGAVSPFDREHPWRKPKPGMILAAAAELRLDLQRSWLVGDAGRDLDAARAAGLAPERCLRVGADAPHRDLAAAAAHILTTPNPAP